MHTEASNWDAVHTIHDYYDHPLSGVADFGGSPHAYACVFDEEEDEWSDEYWLSPITGEQLRLVKEAYAMFLSWRAAHDAGKLGTDDSFPVLAADRPRHDQIRLRVEQALKVDPTQAIRMFAEFEGTWHPMTPDGTSRVRWSAGK